MTRNLVPYLLGIVAVFGAAQANAQSTSPYRSAEDFNRYAMKLREAAIIVNSGPQVQIPTTRSLGVSSRYPWKLGIVTTTFWVGESASQNNPVHNRSSSWDIDWHSSFGGYDDPNPANRRGYLPAKFVPKQNPFYFALPYNDVTRGTTKPESKVVIPWYKQVHEREGKSVCKDRWIAIRKGDRVCYAQWSDCGPFRTDHWQYVFGNERPKPNLNKGAGLDVSPAVRDYLGMAGTDITDWKFVEFREVPKGPWSQYGENNDFVIQSRRTNERVASADPLPTQRSDAPKVRTK